MKYLVTWNSNLAAELNVQGFVVMDEEEWETLQDTLKSKKRTFYIDIGENLDDIEYEDGEQLLDELTSTPINSDEAEFLEKTLGFEFGFCQFKEVEPGDETLTWESDYGDNDEENYADEPYDEDEDF